MNKENHVVSFSGGRTSAYLVYLMEQKRKLLNWNVTYIYMDTGAEHPKTYEFIRSVAEHFKIDLVCLRVVINPELGQANTYEQIDISDLKTDFYVWPSMLKKYSLPYVNGAFCTDRMKLVPYTKYCKDKFGKDYITWLGIRADEPKRLIPKAGKRYLAEISHFDKWDVIDWWKDMPFDLEIPEYLGNCMFCIKKGVNKVALAARAEPEFSAQFNKIITSDSVRIMEGKEEMEQKMYRGKLSFTEVIDGFKEVPTDYLLSQLRGRRQEDSGSCSESCEIFNDENQLDLFLDN